MSPLIIPFQPPRQADHLIIRADHTESKILIALLIHRHILIKCTKLPVLDSFYKTVYIFIQLFLNLHLHRLIARNRHCNCWIVIGITSGLVFGITATLVILCGKLHPFTSLYFTLAFCRFRLCGHFRSLLSPGHRLFRRLTALCLLDAVYNCLHLRIRHHLPVSAGCKT